MFLWFNGWHTSFSGRKMGLRLFSWVGLPPHTAPQGLVHSKCSSSLLSGWLTVISHSQTQSLKTIYHRAWGTQEAEAGGFPWIQDQPEEYNKFQAILSYSEYPILKPTNKNEWMKDSVYGGRRRGEAVDVPRKGKGGNTGNKWRGPVKWLTR